MPSADAPAGDGGGASQPPAGDGASDVTTLTDQPAYALALNISGMPAGWIEVRDESTSPDVSGLRDAHETGVTKVSNSGNSHTTIFTEAMAFNTTADANAYFDDRRAATQEDFSTESRNQGDEAFYWELTDDNVRMILRKANVVWHIEMDRQAEFEWDPTVDWVADTLVAKF